MKKLTKILVAALVFALLIGTVFAFTVSAADESSQPATASEGPWIVSKNVSYEQNTHLFFAIDASVATDSTKLSLNVLDADGNILAEGLTVSAANEDIYKDGSMIAHIIKTPGVAAKDYVDVLTINVYYDGSAEPVESTTYSVAEYFYERLYKNGVIEATAGEALSQKKLYLASLRYGAAAQKVLTDDTILADELVYVGGDVDSAFVDSNNIVLADGIWNVKSYVGDEVVESRVQGGKYFIENSATITQVGEYDPTPENAAEWDVSEDYDYGFANTTKGEKLGIAGGNITDVYYRQHSAAPTLSVIAKNDDAGDYLSISKNTTGGSGQTWMNVVMDNSQNESFIFEVRMRLNITTTGSGYRIRMYTGSRTDNQGGNEVYPNGFVFANSSLSSFYKYGGDKSDAVNLGVSPNTWFTMRISVSDYEEGKNNLVVSILDEAANVFVAKYQAAATDIVDASLISCVCLMDSSSTVYTNDIAYMYAGEDYGNPPAKPELTEFENTASFLTANKGSATVELSTTGYYDILSGAPIAVAEDNSGAGSTGQPTIRMQKNIATASYDTLTLSFDMRIFANRDGGFTMESAGSGFDFRYATSNAGNANNCNLVQLMFYTSGKKLVFSNYTGRSESDKTVTSINAGDFFNVTIVYKSNATTADIVISGGGYTYEKTYDVPASQQGDISAITMGSFVPNTPFIGRYEITRAKYAVSNSAAQ